jgi:hypothetical protein
VAKQLLHGIRVNGRRPLMAKWRNSGFNLRCGLRIRPRQKGAMENLARYIIRASVSQERLRYDAPSATVVYKSKDGNHTFGQPCSPKAGSYPFLSLFSRRQSGK